MRTVLRTTLVVTFIAALFSPTPTVARDACSRVTAETYDVKVNSDARNYRLGDTAEITATVTRKDTGVPVADARVTMGATVRQRWYVSGVAPTNAQGKATIDLELSRDRMRPGIAELSALAYTQRVNAGAACADFTEWGYKRVRRAFRITR